MTEETPAKRGDAAWKEQREAVAKRNADAHKRAIDDQKTRTATVAAAERDAAAREVKQLRDLNERIAKQQARASR